MLQFITEGWIALSGLGDLGYFCWFLFSWPLRLGLLILMTVFLSPSIYFSSRVTCFLIQMPVPEDGLQIKRLIFLKLSQMICQEVLISQEPGMHGSLRIFPEWLSLCRGLSHHTVYKVPSSSACKTSSMPSLLTPSQHHNEKAQQSVTNAYQDSKANN